MGATDCLADRVLRLKTLKRRADRLTISWTLNVANSFLLNLTALPSRLNNNELAD